MASSAVPNPHRLADERSIALHREVVVAIRERPELLDRARSRVEHWIKDGSVARTYATDWRDLLMMPLDRLADRLVDPGEKMRALRQCSPFAGALDPKDRWRILEETKLTLTTR